MKKLLFSLTIVLILPLLFGCVSLMQTAKLQEVIRKPKNYCQLKQSAKKQITLDDITKYDDSKCLKYVSGEEGILLESTIEGKKNEYVGTITEPWGGTDAVIVMPYSVKGVKTNAPGDRGHSVRIDPIPDDICILRRGDSPLYYEYEKYTFSPSHTPEVKVVRIIKKPQLTFAERQKLLKQKQDEIEQKYMQKQQEYAEEYAECNEDYDKIVDFWQTNSSIRQFCGSIENAWFSRACLAEEGDNENCKTLKNLFIDCYQQGAIKASDSYVSMTFFKGLERGKIQLR